METFIFYILKSSICLSLIYGLYTLTLRNTTFLKLKRIYLFVGILTSLILPLISIKKTIVIPSIISNIEKTVNSSTVYSQGNETNMLLLTICSLFVIGVLIRLGFIVRDLLKIYNLYHLCQIQIHGNKKYCISPLIKSPFSFGNCIFISDNFFSDLEQDIIIKHELIHIKQFHIIDLIAGQIVLLMQWFNPIAWLYVKNQKQNLEFITDQTVVQEGISMAEYQATLLNNLLDHQVFTLTQSFNYSNPLKRINMMKRTKTNNLRKLSLVLALPLIGGFLWANTSKVYVTEEEPLKGKVITISTGETSIEKSPLVFVDGVEFKKDLNSIDPNEIESMNVLKGESAIEEYGEKGENGVILITLKKDNSNITSLDLSKQKVLMFVDDVEVENTDNINPNDIESVAVLKGETATKVYGEKGKDGVILITLKK